MAGNSYDFAKLVEDVTAVSQKVLSTKAEIENWAREEHAHWSAVVQNSGLRKRDAVNELVELQATPWVRLQQAVHVDDLKTAKAILAEMRAGNVVSRASSVGDTIGAFTNGYHQAAVAIGGISAALGFDPSRLVYGQNPDLARDVGVGFSFISALLHPPAQTAALRDRLDRFLREGTATFESTSNELRRRGDAQIAELKASTASLKKRAEEAERMLKESNAAIGLFEKEAGALWRALLSAHEDKLASLHTGFENFEKEVREQWVATRAAYDTQLKVDLAHEYWKKKADRHGVVAHRTAWAFGGLLLVVAAVLGWYGPWFVARFPVSSTTAIGLQLAAGALLITPALAVLWGVRVLARILVTNLQAMSEANNRSVMAKTFVALAKDEHSKVGEAERILVLQALFRPHDSTGDDAPPPNLVELILQQLKAQKPPGS